MNSNEKNPTIQFCNDIITKLQKELIFQVMDKELKTIMRFCALLGLVMGSINLLF